jgi:hypothetical protein
MTTGTPTPGTPTPGLHDGWNFLACGCTLHVAGDLPTNAPHPECPESARLAGILNDLMAAGTPDPDGDLYDRRRAAYVAYERHFGVTDTAIRRRWPSGPRPGTPTTGTPTTTERQPR